MLPGNMLTGQLATLSQLQNLAYLDCSGNRCKQCRVPQLLHAPSLPRP